MCHKKLLCRYGTKRVGTDAFVRLSKLIAGESCPGKSPGSMWGQPPSAVQPRSGALSSVSISLVPERDSRKTGLARALSKLGYCSRSQAAELIRAGRITLNAKIRRDPETPVHLQRDQIQVDGKPIESQQKIYLMLNKPRGVVTTASDEKGRDTVYSILANNSEPLPWIAPVGRLDKASEGLLLLTNDSDWAARVLAPESAVAHRHRRP